MGGSTRGPPETRSLSSEDKAFAHKTSGRGKRTGQKERLSSEGWIKRENCSYITEQTRILILLIDIILDDDVMTIKKKKVLNKCGVSILKI